MIGFLVAPVVMARHGPSQNNFNSTSTVETNYVAGGEQFTWDLFVCNQLSGNRYCAGGHHFVRPKNAPNVTLTIDDASPNPNGAIAFFHTEPDDTTHGHNWERFCTQKYWKIQDVINHYDNHTGVNVDNVTAVDIIPSYSPGFPCRHNLIITGGSQLNATKYPVAGKMTADWSSTDNVSTGGPTDSFDLPP